MQPTSVKFVPIITPGGTAGDKSLGMGQHKFVVLRRVAEFPGIARGSLFNSLSMSDAHAEAALTSLVTEEFVVDFAGGLSATKVGHKALE